MPRLTYLLIPLVAACGLDEFDVDQPIPEQAIQGSGIPAPLAALFPLPLDLDLQAKIKEQKNAGSVDKITLSSLRLTITATRRPPGDTDDWSFVESVEVFVASRAPNTTLPKVKIASVANPGAVEVMEFAVEPGVNLRRYVEEGARVDTRGSGTIPADDVSYDGLAVFSVDVL
ncbi:MAG: hypothetical protein KF773_04310 [Deltaproteobacteria bacterium]|nr:hypothetical protein [Deltaproteobacteria bacterium]